MNILLFGKGGQVGWELQRSLSVLGTVTALDFDSTEHCGDFSNPSGVAETVRTLRPDIIVNAAAHTAVDKAESEADFARTLNATTPGAIAQEAAKLGAWLVPMERILLSCPTIHAPTCVPGSLERIPASLATPIKYSSQEI